MSLKSSIYTPERGVYEEKQLPAQEEINFTILTNIECTLLAEALTKTAEKHNIKQYLHPTEI